MPALTVDQIIVRPLITEKNTDLMEQDQYTFEVATTREQDPDPRSGRENSSTCGSRPSTP